MNKVDWLYDDEEEDDGTFDLVGRFNNKYVDVTRNFQGKWSVSYNNKKIKTNIDSREEAKQWAETVDLVDVLCECYA